MIEEWIPIKGYEGLYEVSNLGRVRSNPKIRDGKYRNEFKILKPRINYLGYYEICLSKNNNPDPRTIHELVAQHFIGERPNKMVINHKNHNKLDNKISNLEYCTQKENVRKAIVMGNFRHKEILQFDLNNNFIKKWFSSMDIERTLNFNHSVISKVCNEKYTNYKTAYGFIWKYNLGGE